MESPTNIGTDDAPAYLSNRSIASAIGVDEQTVRADVKTTAGNPAVDSDTNIGTDERPAYLSNRSIASAIGVAEGSIRTDIEATAQNCAVDPDADTADVSPVIDLRNRPTLGEDGKIRQPRTTADATPRLSTGATRRGDATARWRGSAVGGFQRVESTT